MSYANIVVEEVCRYRTMDGKVFYDRGEAEEHSESLTGWDGGFTDIQNRDKWWKPYDAPDDWDEGGSYIRVGDLLDQDGEAPAEDLLDRMMSTFPNFGKVVARAASQQLYDVVYGDDSESEYE